MSAAIVTKLMGAHEQINLSDDEITFTGAGSGRDWASVALMLRASDAGPDSSQTWGDTFDRSDETLDASSSDGVMGQKWFAEPSFDVVSNVAQRVSDSGDQWAYLPSGLGVGSRGTVTIEADVVLAGVGSNERVGFAYGMPTTAFNNKWTVRLNHSTNVLDLINHGSGSEGSYGITPVQDQVYNIRAVMEHGADVKVYLDDTERISWTPDAAEWAAWTEFSWLQIYTRSALARLNWITATVS